MARETTHPHGCGEKLGVENKLAIAIYYKSWPKLLTGIALYGDDKLISIILLYHSHQYNQLPVLVRHD